MEEFLLYNQLVDKPPQTQQPLQLPPLTRLPSPPHKRSVQVLLRTARPRRAGLSSRLCIRRSTRARTSTSGCLTNPRPPLSCSSPYPSPSPPIRPRDPDKAPAPRRWMRRWSRRRGGSKRFCGKAAPTDRYQRQWDLFCRVYHRPMGSMVCVIIKQSTVRYRISLLIQTRSISLRSYYQRQRSHRSDSQCPLTRPCRRATHAGGPTGPDHRADTAAVCKKYATAPRRAVITRGAAYAGGVWEYAAQGRGRKGRVRRRGKAKSRFMGWDCLVDMNN